ncbi:TldD/PmbA family protein [Catelliglobosispora koreensis]|uniref:TldD/PmbA family protein n=1 Tax=Catelliglobosispora koreensis TaxID=129052 RepID=UPI0003759C78|nr:metallopeptidase TldD-related protein [Catelliglobosispora koreensis]
MNADQVLQAMAKALPGADVEVRVEYRDSALTRFANSFIHQNVAEQTTTLGVRANHAGRTVSVTTTTVDLESLAERTKAALAVAPLDPAWPGLTAPSPLVAESVVDDATANATPDERASIVRDFVEAAKGLETAGYCRSAHWTGSYRSTAGQSLDAAATDAAFDGIARLNGADAVARRASARLSDVDGTAMGERVAASVRSLADPVELEPGRYEVVLMPEATADILHALAMYSFNGRFFADGRSFAEPGATQFDSSISIVDDPFFAGRPYDPEGTPRTRLTLVDKGVTKAIAHDRRTAAQAGVASTGHSLGEEGVFGPMPLNPAFLPGTGSVDDMVANVERGLLVTDFWYTRVLDPKTLVITGLTRNGVWLIENGKVVRAVRNLRFTQGYAQALAPGQVLAVGSEVVPQPNRRDLVNSAPVALRLASWNFTGGASG